MALLDEQEIVLMFYLYERDLDYKTAQSDTQKAIDGLSTEDFSKLVSKMRDSGYIDVYEKGEVTYLSLSGIGTIRYDREKVSFLDVLNPLAEKEE